MIKVNAKSRWLLFFSFSLMMNVCAQNPSSQPLPQNHEKIYIQFDKLYYAAGETAWFKAYLYNNGLPSLLSTELYLQLGDENGRVIDKKKFPVAGATVSGSISLDESLTEGYYNIKAITKTIALEDPEFLYTKDLFVYNNNGQPKQVDKSSPEKISLQFFPESGQLIDRIKTQVAFKATDENGAPLELNGVIKSDSVTVINSFKTFHDGIGRLSFTPHVDDRLFAEIDVKGRHYKFQLPVVKGAGVYLKISDADSGKTYEVTRSKTDKDFFDTVMLVVRMNKDTVFRNTIPFGFEQSLSGTLKTKNLPSGILHFIVLNKNGIPIAERLSFVNNMEYIIPAELSIIKRDSSKRGANHFEIRFNDTVQCSFSVSVTDEGVQEYPDKESIYSRLLLTSDLKGYVYNPAFYFEKNDAATKLALDNLMLTHGWTRYNWKRNTSRLNSFNNDDHYLLYFSGMVTDSKNRPVINGKLNLQFVSEDSSIQSFETAVDKNGKFKLDSLIFYGRSKIYYSYVSVNGKDMQVNIQPTINNNEEMFSVLSGKNNDITSAEKPDSAFYEHIGIMPVQVFEGKYKLLRTVSVKTKLKRPADKVNEKYATAVFNSSGKLVLDNINNPYSNSSSNVMDYIMMNVRSLDIDKSNNTVVNKKNFSLMTGKFWKVELFLDESVSTVTSMRTINMRDVALIKFYEAGFVGVGSGAPGGAVAVYLKKEADADPAKSAEVEKFIAVDGYSVTQEFYKPDYTHSKTTNTTADNRTTLYWDSFVKNGNSLQAVKFDFFNNDVSKKICIIIEGFDARGRLLHYEKQE